MHFACRGCHSLEVDLDCLVYQLAATPPYIHMHLSILAQHDVHQQFSAPVCACVQLVYTHIDVHKMVDHDSDCDLYRLVQTLVVANHQRGAPALHINIP